jgi:uncharacterized protein HemY
MLLIFSHDNKLKSKEACSIKANMALGKFVEGDYTRAEKLYQEAIENMMKFETRTRNK